MRASLLHGAAYNNVVDGVNTVIVPNDADSPYTLAAIATDIGDPAVFAWDASSNTAICNAHLDVSGTVHVGKVAGDGSYDAGGNEEKLLMTTNITYSITINSGGALIARGSQGTYGVRRKGTDTLTNEISLIPQTYPKQFKIAVSAGGMITLYDTKVRWCGTTTPSSSGFMINGGKFDIQRCQLYTYEYFSMAIYILTYPYTYTNPIFRDNFIGTGDNTGDHLYNQNGIKIGGGQGSNPTNLQIVNCEFDSSNGSSILNWYAKGLTVIDCKFNRGGPVTIQSAVYPGQMEFRNCEYAAGTWRRPDFSGGGHANTWIKHTSYLGCHAVNKRHPGINVDTGDGDVLVEEQSSPTPQAVIYRFTDGNWSAGTTNTTTGTDATGWTHSSTNEGAILLTEMMFTRVSSITSTNYYFYNLKITPITPPPGYHNYDYYAQQGNKYITSVDASDAANEKCIGPGWYRQDAATPNPTPLLDAPPTNGTWYIGIDPILCKGIIFSVH